MAIITGTSGNDTIASGTSGNDSIDALGGSDTILGTLGNDYIDCGETSSISYWASANFGDASDIVAYADGFVLDGPTTPNARIIADLELGTVRKYGGGTLLGTDTLVGADGVFGTAGNDRISGRGAWDFEEFQGYEGNDTIDGRGGTDGVRYVDDELNTAGITVDMAAGTVTGDSSVGTDTLREIEFVGGTNFADSYDATGYGGASVNRNSAGERYNQFTGLAGADTVVGNGETIINLSGAGGAVSVNLGLQTAVGVAARVITNANSGSFTSGYAPGDDLVSNVYGVRGTRFNDTLTGGGRVNDTVVSETVSGDHSLERFRGDAGNDQINGGTGLDRADYGSSSATATGLTIQLAAGTVTGDANSVGSDTLRGIEVVSGTAFDDNYNAVGFTLSNAASASVNSGDVIVSSVPAGESLASLAFNEFRATAGDDTVSGNGATRLSFTGMAVEHLTGPQPSVVVTFTSASAGNAVNGQTDGGLGSVVFTGVFAARGGVANDSLTGSDGYQSLEGYYGNDTVLGGNGGDILYGHLRGTADDAVNQSSNYTDNDSLNGGAGNDELHGHFGNDTLNGGVGTDTMVGGTGNDVYIVNAIADKVVEAVAGGTDTVQSSAAYTLSVNVERLTLTGSGNVNGSGNTLANLIAGNSGANRLNGLNGNDTLNGGSGNDTLVGGAGKDTLDGGAGLDVFVFASTLNATTNVDTVSGFVAADDRVDLDDAVFAGIGAAGAGLAPSAFAAGTAATTAAHRVIYDQASGNLWFDADGSGAGAKILFALLGAGTALTVADVFVI